MSISKIIVATAAAGAFAYAVSSSEDKTPQSCHLNADGIVELTMGDGKVVANKHWRVTEDNKTCYADTNPPLFVPAR